MPLMMGAGGAHHSKIYLFAGSQMYNRKLQIRESDARLQIFTYAAEEGLPTMRVAKTESLFEITPRKGHSSSIYRKALHYLTILENSMIIYGGELNTGKVTDEMLSLNLTNLDWIRVEVTRPNKKGMYHGACTSVFRDNNLI